jgi:uncharacterized protein YecE (DUF72 family)
LELIDTGEAGMPTFHEGVEFRLGTSGYSYDDWRGVYYPAGLPRGALLDFYSGSRARQTDLLAGEPAPVFDSVEINATYYRLPPARVFAGMAARTPPGFLFSVKAPGGVTHPESYGSLDRLLVEDYCAAVTPLAEAGKLGPTLLQFPYRFKPDRTGLDYLRAVAEEFAGLQPAVEFRRRDWLEGPGPELCAELGLSWVSVDLPRLKRLPPPLVVTTTPTIYVRFHGRRTDTWWRGDNVTRYDYAYGEDELAPWVRRLKAVNEPATESTAATAKHKPSPPELRGDDADLERMIRLISGPLERVFLFFNNHPRGKAVEAAAALRRMLGGG